MTVEKNSYVIQAEALIIKVQEWKITREKANEILNKYNLTI